MYQINHGKIDCNKFKNLGILQDSYDEKETQKKVKKLKKKKCPCSPTTKCVSDLKESSKITICEKKVDIYGIAQPHLIYSKSVKCDTKKCPQAPIIKFTTDLPDLAFGTGTVQVQATAVDTKCAAEFASFFFPAESVSSQKTLFSSDAAYTVISGTVEFFVGPFISSSLPEARTLNQGDFIYIHAGTPYSFKAVTDISLSGVFIGAGYLGYINQVSIYQNAVGLTNVDPIVLKSIEANYCIKAPLSEILGNANSIVFLPRKEDECSASWGLSKEQILVLASQVPLSYAIDTAASIYPRQRSAELTFTQTGLPVILVAQIIRNPECGNPDILAIPTINNSNTFESFVGATYSVYYDRVTNNVTLILVGQTQQ